MKYLVLLGSLIFSHAALANGGMNMTGVGSYSDLRAGYFYGALYTEIDSVNASEILASKGATRMEMKILANSITKRRFYKLMNEMIAISNNVAELEYHAANIIQFTGLVEDKFHRGDHIVIDNSSGNTLVSINGVDALEVPGRSFINVLLKGWIGRFPPTANFKNDLLAKTKSPYFDDYMNLNVAPSRVEAIREWNTPVKVAIEEKRKAQQFEQQEIARAELAKQKVKAEIERQQARALDKKQKAQQRRNSEQKIVLIERKKKQARQARLAKIKKENEARKQAAKAFQLVESGYYRKLMVNANKSVVYPKKAYERGQQGLVKVRIVIDKRGMIQSLDTVQSSQVKLLDKAALYSAKSAEPYPVVPDAIMAEGELYDFTIPYRFKL